MTISDLVDVFNRVKPTWLWEPLHHDGVVDVHLFAPELRGSSAPARDRIGLSYWGRGATLEEAFGAALSKITKV